MNRKLTLCLLALSLIGYSVGQDLKAKAEGGGRATAQNNIPPDKLAFEPALLKDETEVCSSATNHASCRFDFLNAIKYTRVRLSPNGTMGVSLSTCGGPLGCTYYLLKRSAGGYQKIFGGFPGTDYVVEKTITNGVYDITESYRATSTKYVWSGSEYISEDELKASQQKKRVASAHTTRYNGVYIEEQFQNGLLKTSGCSADADLPLVLDKIVTKGASSACTLLVGDEGKVYEIVVFTRKRYIDEYRELVTKYGPSLPGRYALLSTDRPDCCNVWRTHDGTVIGLKESHVTMRGGPNDAYGRGTIPYTMVTFTHD